MTSTTEPSKGETPPTEQDLSGIFINRELSWLDFNARVLHEATDERTPLLERLRFLSIFTSNLDEFFMKRVGGLKRQIAANVTALTPDGMTASQQMQGIRRACFPMLIEQARIYRSAIVPALKEHGIALLDWKHLNEGEVRFAERYFFQNVFPILTPMAVDPGHPFPYLSNLSLSLGVKMHHPRLDDQLFARVKVPDMLPGWLPLPNSPGGELRFVRLLDVIRYNLDALFPGMEVLSVTPFRVTRNADIERDEEDAEDLLELIAQELRERRFERIVRLEHDRSADPWTVHFLMNELQLAKQEVYELNGELDYTGMGQICDLDRPELRYPTWMPVLPQRLKDEDADIFSIIRSGDLMVHHPFESFSESVEKFIRNAANDPKVLAIKITLYRIGDSRSLMDSLIGAAEQGKQVVCLVELKARFDEQRNIFWAQQLERAGVHVVYGIVGLKTHTKLSLVIRNEDDGIRAYTHIGTGNYNIQTARLYTDIGLFTCREEMTSELVELFHYLTGHSLKVDYETLLVAPVNMRERFTAMIEREIEHQQAGRPAGIVAKMNSLEDRRIVEVLSRASQAGVPIKLIVRGFCCLRPQVPGLTENIEIMSVIGRFLEHSRIFHFRNGAEYEVDGEFFIGSADWMYRNLNRRVELIAPVVEPNCRQRLWEVLQMLLADRRQTWDMDAEGNYTQRKPTNDEEAVGIHERLMQMARRAADRVGLTLDSDEKA